MQAVQKEKMYTQVSSMRIKMLAEQIKQDG